jgi:5'-3' exonuclease
MGKLNEVLKQQKKLLNQDEEKVIDDYIQVVGFIVGDEEFAVPILSINFKFTSCHCTSFIESVLLIITKNY